MTAPQLKHAELVALKLFRVAEALEGESLDLFRDYELSGPQYNVLRILRGASTELRCQELSNRMITRVPDITRLLDRLEARSLVMRRRCTDDRRAVLVKISPAGSKLLGRIDRPLKRLIRGQFTNLNAGELQTLDDLLSRLEGRAASE